MLSEIEENYKKYKDIHANIISKIGAVSNEVDMEMTKNLLENSLYLSVFTTFENFLKELIDNYNINKSEQGVKFTDLSNRIAHSMFLSKKKHIMDIFQRNDSKKAFDAIFNEMRKEIKAETLKNHIRFEFLHKDKLNGHYKDLFQEILGDSDFLDKIKIELDNGLVSDVDKKWNSNAATFLYQYTDEIRNNIAHENEKFKISDISSFEQVVDIFQSIIVNISERYKSHTGFDLEKDTSKNLMDNFK